MEASAPSPTEDETARRRHRIAVMVSGNGSNLQAILDACKSGSMPAEVAAVVSNKPDVFALQRADAAGVPAIHVAVHPHQSRDVYDERLADVVAGFSPDVVVLAGWMRLLTMSFLRLFPESVINLHPALPGQFPGTRAIERAWDAALAGTCSQTGVMMHLVPDAGVDDGPVLATSTVDINSFDTFDEFEKAVHDVEHQLLVTTLIGLCSESPIKMASNYRRPSFYGKQAPDFKEIPA